MINHWQNYQKLVQVSIMASPFHQISCSKYGSTLDHAYFAVLDQQSGRITLWEEVVGVFKN